MSNSRKKEPVKILAITDSITKQLTINSKNSFSYYSNLCFNYGIGMLIDHNNPKRYKYPTKIYINSSDTANNYYRFGHANNKGDILFHISLPYINSFLLKPVNECIQSNTGFWGITAGFDYYHSKNQFFNLSASAVSDFFVPFPAAVDISGEYVIMTSTYLSLSNNHKINRFSLGYGASVGKNTWDLRYYDRFDPPPPTRDPVKKSNNAIGLIFTCYFQTGERFNIGVVYRPTYFRLNTYDKFQYEHLISIDFAWKIKLTKKIAGPN